MWRQHQDWHLLQAIPSSDAGIEVPSSISLCAILAGTATQPFQFNIVGPASPGQLLYVKNRAPHATLGLEVLPSEVGCHADSLPRGSYHGPSLPPARFWGTEMQPRRFPECSPRLMHGCRASCSCTWLAAGRPSFESRLSYRAQLATGCCQRKHMCIPGTRRMLLCLLCRGCHQLSRLHSAFPQVKATTQSNPPGRRQYKRP